MKTIYKSLALTATLLCSTSLGWTATTATTNTLPAVCSQYEKQLASLTEQVKDAVDNTEASSLITDFTDTYPEAMPCIAGNELFASILAEIEPAAGEDGGAGGPEIPGSEPENPNQLNEPPANDPTPPEEEKCQYEYKNYENE